MKYDSLLKELEKLHGIYEMTGNGNANTAKLLWECHDAIVKLQSTSKWTKVVDSRPPNTEDVIAYLQYPEESRIAMCNYDKGVWWDALFNDDVGKNVTHWMPKPLPPEIEK